MCSAPMPSGCVISTHSSHSSAAHGGGTAICHQVLWNVAAIPMPNRLIRSSRFKRPPVPHSPYAGNLLGTESMVQVLQMLLQVLQAFPLRPVIRISVEVPEVPAIPL